MYSFAENKMYVLERSTILNFVCKDENGGNYGSIRN